MWKRYVPLALWLLSIQPGLASSSAIPIRILRGYLIVAPVMVNGEGPHPFIVDTGTSTTVFSSGFASRLGLSPDQISVVPALSGSVLAGRAEVDELSLGTARIGPTAVLITDLPALSSLDSRIVGILGQDFLGRFDYTIDYKRRVIVFGADQSESGTVIPFERDAGRMLVSARIPVFGQSPVRLTIDSALAEPMFFRPNLPPAAARVRVQSVSQSHSFAALHVPALHLGPIRLRNLDSLIAREDPTSGRVENGLLPLHLLGSVHVSNRGNYILVKSAATP